MSARIDHATVARTILSNIEPVEMTNPETGNWLAKAQVSALLALVEQQRIANLIALGQFRVGVNDLPHLRHLTIEPNGEHDIQPVAAIREALGLS